MSKDNFEKIFGKEPESGYDFTYTQITCGWQSVVIKWGARGVGFGQLGIIISEKDGSIFADTECMNKEFCDAVVEKACENLDKDFPHEEDKAIEGSYYSKDRNGLLNSDFVKNLYKQVDWTKSI